MIQNSRDDRYIKFNYYTTKKELYEENGLEGYITRNIQLDSEKNIFIWENILWFQQS